MRAVITVLLLTMFVGSLSALDAVQFELVRTFPNGSGINEFKQIPDNGYESYIPEGLAYVDGSLYVGDNINSRVVRLGPDLAWSIVREGVNPLYHFVSNPHALLALGTSYSFALFDLDQQILVSGGNFVPGFSDVTYYDRAAVAGDMLFVVPESAGGETRYFGSHIPEDFDGQIEMMNPQETIRYLKEDYKGTEEFSVDEDGYIFWNGRLVAPYGYSYARYHWNTNRPTTEWQATILFSQFIGWDRDGNTHWSDHRKISVLNPQGETLAFFEASNVADTSRSQFTVTPEGTLYVLSYNRDLNEFELMKLERFW